VRRKVQKPSILAGPTERLGIVPFYTHSPYMTPMPRKTSIYVDANSEAILAARDGARSEIRRHGRRSLIFRELIRRYDDICRRADPPDLTEPEWNVLVEAGERWAEQTGIDAGVRWGRLLAVPGRNERFLKKLLELGPAAQIAVIDYIERYWAAKSRNETLPAFPGRNGAREPVATRASSRK
jgi:hypothetical protein